MFKAVWVCNTTCRECYDMKTHTCRIRSPSLIRPSLAAMLFGSTCTKEAWKSMLTTLPCVSPTRHWMPCSPTNTLSSLLSGIKVCSFCLFSCWQPCIFHVTQVGFRGFLCRCFSFTPSLVAGDRVTCKSLTSYKRACESSMKREGKDHERRRDDSSKSPKWLWHRRDSIFAERINTSRFIETHPGGSATTLQALDNHFINFVVLTLKIKRDSYMWRKNNIKRLPELHWCYPHIHFNEGKLAFLCFFFHQTYKNRWRREAAFTICWNSAGTGVVCRIQIVHLVQEE